MLREEKQICAFCGLERILECMFGFDAAISRPGRLDEHSTSLLPSTDVGLDIGTLQTRINLGSKSKRIRS